MPKLPFVTEHVFHEFNGILHSACLPVLHCGARFWLSLWIVHPDSHWSGHNAHCHSHRAFVDLRSFPACFLFVGCNLLATAMLNCSTTFLAHSTNQLKSDLKFASSCFRSVQPSRRICFNVTTFQIPVTPAVQLLSEHERSHGLLACCKCWLSYTPTLARNHPCYRWIQPRASDNNLPSSFGSLPLGWTTCESFQRGKQHTWVVIWERSTFPPVFNILPQYLQ